MTNHETFTMPLPKLFGALDDVAGRERSRDALVTELGRRISLRGANRSDWRRWRQLTGELWIEPGCHARALRAAKLAWAREARMLLLEQLSELDRQSPRYEAAKSYYYGRCRTTVRQWIG